MSKVIVICQSCGWKRISEEDGVGLVEIKNDSLSGKKYRCPGCGRAITSRKFSDPQGDHELREKEKAMKEENEKWMKEHLEFRRKFTEESNDE